MFLVCHRNLQVHDIEGSRDLMSGGLHGKTRSRKFGGQTHCGGGDIMFLRLKGKIPHSLF